MSGKKSRNKGAAGEREFFKLVEEHLGVKLRRNLSQYQENGLGDAKLADFHLEIKRGKVYESRWWRQAVMQTPDWLHVALCYRLDRQQWKVKLCGPDWIEELSDSDLDQETGWNSIEISLEAFFQIVRERL